MIINETLFDHLQQAGISKKEACELFGKSERTLKRWNNSPPHWVLRIVQLMEKRPPFPDCWNNWYFDNEYIVDEAGNKFHINEVSSIFWNRQLIQSLTGDKMEVYSLKSHLDNKIKQMDSTIKISLENSGEEIKSWKIAL